MSDIFILDKQDEENKNTNQQDTNKEGNFNSKGGENISIMDRINLFLIQSQSLQIKDKVIFFRLLSIMLNAGITLSKGIQILEKQEKEGTVLKLILQRFTKELKEGHSLSSCFALYLNSFSAAEIGMIESGEKTGKLNGALKDLADQVEKLSSINGKLKSALMYPAMIVMVLVGVIFVMMTLVVPKLLEIFGGSDNLPLSTRILKNISDFFVSYWYIPVGFFTLFFVLKAAWYKTMEGKYYIDKWGLKMPIFGMISQKIILSKFSRVLSGMMKSGVSIVESLRITSDAVGNEYYRQRILLLRDDIKKGLKMYESLDGDPYFPEMMVSMIQIGEQSAKVDEIILKIADFYDEEVDNVVGVINKLLEPIIIVTMAVVVGFIAVAIMQPIMNMANEMTS